MTEGNGSQAALDAGPDRRFAEVRGRDSGGDIFIHGQPNRLPLASSGARIQGDWTDGCIAVSDAEMDELRNAIADGTPIEIRRCTACCNLTHKAFVLLLFQQ